MTGKGETIYLKIGRNILVHESTVYLKDIASVTGTCEPILRQTKQMKVYSFSNPGNIAFSVLRIIELILKMYPQVTIVNEGETDFLVEYRSRQANKIYQTIKTVIVWLLIFFGAAFTIMAFHNDISITELFDKFYGQIAGGKKPAVTPLEICYSLGLAVGILVFFNHFGNKKLTHDPTPIQVEMRKYEKDVDTAFIENASRRDESIDAS